MLQQHRGDFGTQGLGALDPTQPYGKDFGELQACSVSSAYFPAFAGSSRGGVVLGQLI